MSFSCLEKLAKSLGFWIALLRTLGFVRGPGSSCRPGRWLENSSKYLQLRNLQRPFKIITARDFFFCLAFVCCQLTRLSRFVIRRREKRRFGAANLRQRFRHSVSVTESLSLTRFSALSSENLPCVHITLTFCVKPSFPGSHTSFGKHTIMV